MVKQGHVPAAERIFGKAKKALLVKLKQGAEVKNFRVHKERIVVGTVSSADIRLTGDGISPIHAVIEMNRETGDCTIFDLASGTGIFVNGTKVVTQALKTGDEVTVGRLNLKVFVEDSEVLKPSKSSSAPVSSQMDALSELAQEGDDLRALLDPSAPVIEIFDYKATQKRAVEVVMTWCGTILDIGHFVKEKEITVGSDYKAHAHFPIPAVLASSRFVLAENTDDECVIHIDPTMRGVIQKQGQIRSIKEMGLSRISLTRDDFAKISIGDVDFYFSHTQAPPRLRTNRIEKDPLLFRLLGTSLVLSLAVSFLLKNAVVPPVVEAEKVPERLATVLYQPEKYQKLPKWMREPPALPVETPPAPKPEVPKKTEVKLTPKPVDPNKPIPKILDVGNEKATQKGKKAGAKQGAQQAQSMAKEGAGARAKGVEGERGSKKAPPSNDKQKAALRPSAQGGQGRGGGNSEVGDIGNIDALKGATSKIENLLSGSSAQLGKGGSSLQGFGAFTTQGQGGLAIAGKGTGGGGTADSLGGLADKGRGGGRVGTGLGAAGTGSGFVGGKARVDIRSGGPEETVVMGSIDTDAIMAILNQHRDEFRLCYEREINAENPDIRGTVGMSFEIGSTGRVTQAGITSSSLKNNNTERCVVQVLKRIQFPAPRGGGVVEVRYAIKYSPIGG